jgi:hypothetical protein
MKTIILSLFIIYPFHISAQIISARGGQCLAVCNNGSVMAWGQNFSGVYFAELNLGTERRTKKIIIE